MRSPTTPRSAAALVLVVSTLAISRGADEPSRIDQVLARWEAQATGRKTIDVRFTREDREVAWNARDEFGGTLLVKDAETAAVDLTKRGDPPTRVERLIWTGSEVRQFDARTKQIFLFPRPKGIPPKLPDAVCLPFLLGRKAAELKKDYLISLMNEDDKSYLIGFNVIATAASTFRTAFVELDKETMLPRRLLLVGPNGKDTQDYRVTSIRLNEPIPEAVFEARAVKGWKVITSPRWVNRLWSL